MLITVVKWFEYVERINNRGFVIRAYRAKVLGSRRSRIRRGWGDKVRDLLMQRGLSVRGWEEAG